MYGDASAALGIIHRKGLGRTRHIDTGLLWIQQTAAEKRLKYFKVLGKDNPADLFTEYLSAEVSTHHRDFLGIYFKDGRAKSAPQLQHLKALWDLETENDRLHRTAEHRGKADLHESIVSTFGSEKWDAGENHKMWEWKSEIEAGGSFKHSSEVSDGRSGGWPEER